ncbi:MAG TPA: ABC transporter ATP-binding protein [Candidatus Methylomirabilis sp.]|nr:ABC transporter ATP-binding protein [Candidatus Methylomirabilis sp.]
MSALLEIDALRAGYGDHEILRGVDLRVEAGEIVAIIGPNGAGKSTLLKTVAGLLSPRAGDVRLDGEQIGGSAPDAIIRRGLCYVPQEANIFPGLTVEENLTIGGWASPSPWAERARAVVSLFPTLGQRRRQRAGTLSGGERQMLAIAMALMVEPRLLLLDEPSAGLAPALQRMIFDRIRDINARGVAIVLVEQNARESLQLCRRGYVLVMGQTRAEGPGRALLEDPEIRKAYLGG